MGGVLLNSVSPDASAVGRQDTNIFPSPWHFVWTKCWPLPPPLGLVPDKMMTMPDSAPFHRNAIIQH